MSHGYDGSAAREWPEPDGSEEEPTEAAPCRHQRVREIGLPRLVKGPPDPDPTRKPTGFHVYQAGTCLDCGWPIHRRSGHMALGSWSTVATNARPLPKRRRDAA